ncbi:MAG: hypothetical protein QOE70_1907 [Chthoniobacter sp.]|jgi:hypothetical protein|nr:hypothetical protein [Chthoniobacter sp.]
MSPALFTLAASLLGAATLSAAGAAPALRASEVPAAAPTGTPAAGKGTGTTGPAVTPYALKSKSAFTLPHWDQRAPFWPIGWTKRQVGVVATPVVPVAPLPKIEIDEKSFKLTSVLLGNPALAILNGRTYSEGEFLRTPRSAGGAATVSTSPLPPGVRIRVYRINDGSVVLQFQNQLLTIPLQRPELAQKRAEDELLTEDRP